MIKLFEFESLSRIGWNCSNGWSIMLQTPWAECIARYVGNMNQLEPLLLDVEHSKLRVSGHTNTPNSHTKNNLRIQAKHLVWPCFPRCFYFYKTFGLVIEKKLPDRTNFYQTKQNWQSEIYLQNVNNSSYFKCRQDGKDTKSDSFPQSIKQNL
jgi:hypothetical protein